MSYNQQHDVTSVCHSKSLDGPNLEYCVPTWTAKIHKDVAFDLCAMILDWIVTP